MFNYLGSLITCTRETKCRVVKAKSALSNKKTIFRQNVLKFKEETTEMLQRIHNFVCS
jgi:hypothetical protein